MGAGQIIFRVLFFLVAIPLVILILISSKQDEAPTVITGGTENYFGKNKKQTKEAKIDLAIRILAIAFVVLVVLSYLV